MQILEKLNSLEFTDISTLKTQNEIQEIMQYLEIMGKTKCK